MQVQCTCEQCGLAFEAYAFLGRRFCSRSCRTRWLNANVPRAVRTAARVTVPCPTCAGPISVLASRVQRNPTCSEPCLAALRRAVQQRGETRPCVTCGQQFWVSPARARAGARFCSLRCRDLRPKQERRRSETRDSAEYRDWRLAVYRRDDFTCQRCNERGGRNLHAHHLKGWTRFPALRFDLSNGLTLCNPCHVAWHQEHGWR